MNYWNTLGKMNKELNAGDKLINTHVCSIREGMSFTKSENSDNLTEMHFSFEEVKDSIGRANNNKAPGIDTITNE